MKLARWIFLVVLAGVPLLSAAGRQAHAEARQLPVAKVTLYPGDVIGDDMVGTRSFATTGTWVAAVFRQRDGLIGKVVRRTLLPGQPIATNAVREPFAVNQGKSCPIIFEADGLVITGFVMPLQSGMIGDIISVQNVDSGMVVKARVEGNGRVRVEDQ